MTKSLCFTAGELEILRNRRLCLKDDPAVTLENPDADLIRTRLYARVGRVQLPTLLLAIDSETHFSWELLGRPASTPEELVPLYAAILVNAMALDATDVAMMIPGIQLSAIRRASVHLENDRELRTPIT